VRPPLVGVVVVTHNSATWLPKTLESISEQTHLPNRVVIVDDYSTDDTGVLVHEWAASVRDLGVSVETVTSTSVDEEPRTRIARNFTQGVRMLSGVDFVALADHDDAWLPHRLEVQSALMSEQGSSYLASNGLLEGVSGTLVEAFDVPDDIENWEPHALLRHVLRHSVATGSASMIRPDELLRSESFVPPPRWLHDRWWSILVAIQGALQISREPVIKYRISPGQSVGLDRGRQSAKGFRRFRSIEVADLDRVIALHALKEQAAPKLRGELTWGRLTKTLR
jgi:glycosyltransferase involved in cell wall biosynthesis